MKEGKARKIVTILLQFYHRNALIKDHLKLEEQKEMARAGVYEVKFEEYLQKQLVCKLSIKKEDMKAKTYAIKYALTQLYRKYDKRRIEQLQVFFDGELLPNTTNQLQKLA